MVVTTRYCDICGKEIKGKFFQLQLPAMNVIGDYVLSEEKQDICSNCFRELYWKIGEIKENTLRI